MYQALYRKYRPADFKDVYGQPHVVRTLKNQIAEGKLSHAYLFTGSRGTGKTTCAKIFAKAVNCLNAKEGNPCGECEICRAVADDTLVDITEIDAASNNGVDDIRALRDNTAYTPVMAKYRVFIIDEVHMLSISAFNALLKTLEEPPEHVIFILATTEVHKLPATILSRCQRFDFRRIQPEDIVKRLMEVASFEGIDLQESGAQVIAKLADGAMRDALSLLDVCSADGGKIDEEKALEIAGLSGREYLYEMAAAIVNGDSVKGITLIDSLYRKAKDLSRLCSELISYFRDMMMVKTLGLNSEKYILASSEELKRIKEMTDIVPLEKIVHVIDVFEETLLRISRGAERKTAVERSIIMLCDPALDTSLTALLARIQRLEKGAPVIKEEQELPPPIPTPTPTPTSAPVEGEFEGWQEVMAELSSTDKMLKAVLKGSRAFIKEDIVLIDIVSDTFRDLMNEDSRHRNALKSAIFKVTGKQYRIGPYNREQKPAPAVEEDPLDSLIKNAQANGLM